MITFLRIKIDDTESFINSAQITNIARFTMRSKCKDSQSIIYTADGREYWVGETFEEILNTLNGVSGRLVFEPEEDSGI